MDDTEEGYGIEAWDVDYDDLEFYELVGKGNFGCVWSGEYIGTPVAIKKVEQQGVEYLPEESIMDEELAAKYLQRELSVLKSIHHPNVVQFMGICKHSSGVYLVTEWVGGGDLRKLLKARNIPITWKERVEIAKDTAIAMSFLHAKKCIHRDLKPANLLLTEHGRVKVCDMGLARTVNEAEKKSDKKYYTIAGTDVWMAPEVILGDAYDNKCDVYSFGCVVYALIKRHSPPSRKPADGFGMPLDTLLADIPKQCPDKLVQLMRDCMEYEADRRPAFREVCQRLKTLLLELPEEEEEQETHIEIEGERIEIGTVLKLQEERKSQAKHEEELRLKQEAEEEARQKAEHEEEERKKAEQLSAMQAKEEETKKIEREKKRSEEELRRQKANKAAAAAAAQQQAEEGLDSPSSAAGHTFGAESLRNRRFALLLQAVEGKDKKPAATAAPPSVAKPTTSASSAGSTASPAKSAGSTATKSPSGPKAAAAANEAARNKRFAALLSMINEQD